MMSAYIPPRLDGPVLETERLILRLPEQSDFDAWAECMADVENSRFIGGHQERAAAWRAMASAIGAWHLRGFGFFSVIDKATDAWVGRIGPHYPEAWPDREVGWTLHPAHHGKGYAYEAAVACMEFAFTTLGWDRVIHIIDPENHPSIALATRLGSLRDGHVEDLRPFGISADIYAQTREQWTQRQ